MAMGDQCHSVFTIISKNFVTVKLRNGLCRLKATMLMYAINDNINPGREDVNWINSSKMQELTGPL